MKNISIFRSYCVALTLVVIFVWVNSAGADQRSSGVPIIVRVSSEKSEYLPGEIVKLRFEIANEGKESVDLPHKPHVGTGYLKVWISSDGEEYNVYNNSSWGLLEGSGVSIRPGDKFVSDAAVLWNNKPQISRPGEGKILTDYAFPRPGTYYIKAVASVPAAGYSGELQKVASTPIRIRITEPSGDDLKVWNLIKDEGDIAYFVQQSDTPTYKDKKAERLLQEVERIVRSFPESSLGRQMKEKLDKFQTEDSKRTVRLKNAKVQPSLN